MAGKALTGKVSAIDITGEKGTFTVMNDERPVAVTVDENTKYFVVKLPAGGLKPEAKGLDKAREAPAKAQGLERAKQAVEKAREKKAGAAEKKPSVRNQEADAGNDEKANAIEKRLAEKARQAAADRWQALRKFAKPGTVADLAVGVRVAVPEFVEGAAAKNVLIVKNAPAKMATVKGTIKAGRGHDHHHQGR